MDILYQFSDWLSKKGADQGKFCSGSTSPHLSYSLPVNIPSNWTIKQPPCSTSLRKKDPLFPTFVGLWISTWMRYSFNLFISCCRHGCTPGECCSGNPSLNRFGSPPVNKSSHQTSSREKQSDNLPCSMRRFSKGILLFIFFASFMGLAFLPNLCWVLWIYSFNFPTGYRWN